MQDESPLLFIVATPIGNLKDFSDRARETLMSVDYVLCEDTRRARKLKTHFGFRAPLVSFHEHNEKIRIRKVLAMMKSGKTFALVSDAGTPLLSDPGSLLIRKMIAENLPFTYIPGPNAVISALVLSGFPSQPFSFIGFLPVQQAKRSRALEKLANLTQHTIVLFESPDRVVGLLREIGEQLGDRDVAICRELTKQFEEVIRGRISDVTRTLTSRKILGEFTIVMGPGPKGEVVAMSDESIKMRFANLVEEGLSRKEALKKVSKESGRSRNELYQLLINR
jgi:16S rRNA (cytidine1402-2'-O)-methyltransferase